MTDPRVRQPRALFLFTEVFANGGIQRFNRTILEACGRLGLRCVVLSLNDSSASVVRHEKNANVSVVGYSGNRRRFALAAAGALLWGPYDRVIIGHINFLILSTVVLALRPLHRAPSMLIAHGIEAWSGIGFMRRVGLKRIRRILCVSRYTRQRILDQARALIPERLTVFPNALAHTWNGSALPPSRPTPARRFILSVTRLERGDRYKGVASVIEAFSMLEDQTLDYRVIGQGNDLPFLALTAERFGVKDRVHFMRGIGDEELISLYGSCEAFVLPSGKEGFGIVFLEAMYFGAPVIAAGEKGALDVILDGETGLTVRFGDVIELKEAIERIRSDGELRERLRANGRATVVDGGDFTFAKFKQRCAEVFDLPPSEAPGARAASCRLRD
jgi:phosphatidyl-myo-inositol dimannoside synthase